MKILNVFVYDCHQSAALRNAALGIMRALQDAGHQVCAVSPNGDPNGNGRVIGGTIFSQVYYFPEKKVSTQEAEKIVATQDVVLLWWIVGVSRVFFEVAKKTGKKTIFFSSGVFVSRSCYRFVKKFVCYNFITPVLRGCTKIVCPTSRELGQCARLLPCSMVSERVAYIPHMLESASVKRESVRLGEFTFGYLGRLDVQVKGLDTLLLAFAVLCSLHVCKLVLAGPDWHGGRLQLERIIHKYPILRDRVSFIGPVYGEDKEKFFQSIDGYIQLSRQEGFGITIVEAMLRHLPVMISEDANICDDLISEDACFLIRGRDAVSVASQMANFVEDATIASEVADRGMRWAMTHCSSTSVGSQLDGLLRNL